MQTPGADTTLRPSERFDTIIVGTGFALSFFLAAYLAKAKTTERILILDEGTSIRTAGRFRTGGTPGFRTPTRLSIGIQRSAGSSTLDLEEARTAGGRARRE